MQRVEDQEDAEQLKQLIMAHKQATDSIVAQDILAGWSTAVSNFTKVMPKDYEAYLKKQKALAAAPTERASGAVSTAQAAASDGSADIEDMFTANSSSGCTGSIKSAGEASKSKERRRGKKLVKRSDAAAAQEQNASVSKPLNKLRGFIEYERNPDAYR